MAKRRRFTPGPGAVQATKAALAVGALALTVGGVGVLAAGDVPTQGPLTVAAQPAPSQPPSLLPREGRRSRSDRGALPGGSLTPAQPDGSGAPVQPAPSDGQIQAPAPRAPVARSRSSR